MSHSNNRIIHKYISIMVQSNKRQPYLPPNVKVVAFSVGEGYNISATTFETLLGGNSYGGLPLTPLQATRLATKGSLAATATAAPISTLGLATVPKTCQVAQAIHFNN